jgi:hypothetical protein
VELWATSTPPSDQMARTMIAFAPQSLPACSPTPATLSGTEIIRYGLQVQGNECKIVRHRRFERVFVVFTKMTSNRQG